MMYSKISIIIVLFTIFSCKHQEVEKESESVFTVTSPIQIDTTIYNEYVCQIQAINRIEIRSQEKGYLQKIYIDEGHTVKKGQLMYQIMPIIYTAEMEKAKAEMKFVEIEYLNTKSLADKNIVSENELALAKAKLEKAKAELSLAEAHLSFTEIRAPFDGIVDRLEKRLGSLIDEGEQLTTLSDNSQLWVYFNVPESEYLDFVQNGKPTNNKKVLLQMANKEMFEFPGVVETIEGEFDNETGNIAFRATFPNPKRILRHGETGNVLMPSHLKNAIVIPQKATYDVLDKKYVYTVDDQGVLTAKQITVISEIPHLYVVGSGLEPSDKILAEGLGKVKNNEKIQFEFVSMEKEMEDLHQLHAE